MERVLEVGEVDLAGVAHGRDIALLDRDRGPPGGLRHGRPCAHDRIRLELDADEEVPGKRRAMATSQRPPPQWTSTTGTRGAGPHQLRQRRQHLLEEDRDVLERQALDGDAVAIGAVRQGSTGPEEVRHDP